MKRQWLVVPGITFAILLVEHFIPHGLDLNPVHHWLSEYVLSSNPLAVILMRVAFLGLAATAATVAVPAVKPARLLLIAGAFGLFGMTFFDTEPNGIPLSHFSWPPTSSQVHKLLLYFTLSMILVGMGMQTDSDKGKSQRPMIALTAIAFVATIIQTVLIAQSHAQLEPTRFGGITERIVVISMLAWSYLALRHSDQGVTKTATQRFAGQIVPPCPGSLREATRIQGDR